MLCRLFTARHPFHIILFYSHCHFIQYQSGQRSYYDSLMYLRIWFILLNENKSNQEKTLYLYILYIYIIYNMKLLIYWIVITMESYWSTTVIFKLVMFRVVNYGYIKWFNSNGMQCNMWKYWYISRWNRCGRGEKGCANVCNVIMVNMIIGMWSEWSGLTTWRAHPVWKHAPVTKWMASGVVGWICFIATN